MAKPPSGSPPASSRGGRKPSARAIPAPAAGEMLDDPEVERDEDLAERDPNTDDMFGEPGRAAAEPGASQAAAAISPASGEPQRPYIVLARKYRPATFADLIGQDAMVTTLRNAFASDRIAQAYMLTGVRGVGKTTTARILARALNYSGPGTPGKPTIDLPALGEHCQAIMESRHPDVLEMDAASNTGVDNVREIIEGARYRPAAARTKVYIIDEVHMLSKGAFNALLKTLEEPPPHVKFIFATTEIRKVPVTVLSRCQRFDLRRVGAGQLASHFHKVAAAEGVAAEPEALALIARAAEGSVRDGLSILDQAIAMSGADGGEGRVTGDAVRAMLGLADRGRVLDLLESVLGGDAAGALSELDRLHRDGAEPIQLLGDLAEAVHLAARTKAAGPGSLGELLSEDERKRAAALAGKLSMPLLARAWQMLLKGLEEAARAPDPHTAAEMLLIRMAYSADLPTPDDLIRGAAGSVVARNGGRTAAPAGNGQGTPAPAPRSAASEPLPAANSDVPLPATFTDLVSLVGQRRDARLKVLLEEQVSLVRYEPGRIEIHLLQGAPRELANELREKLNAWTRAKWTVAVAGQPGARTLGEVARGQEAARLAEAMADPLVQEMLKHFPDAEVLAVRPLEPRPDGEDEAGSQGAATG